MLHPFLTEVSPKEVGSQHSQTATEHLQRQVADDKLLPDAPTLEGSEPLKPINTTRLRALQKQTKYGAVDLLEDGRLRMDMLNSTFIMYISPDGQRVRRKREYIICWSGRMLDANA